MERVVLAWDNSCDRCSLAVMVTAPRLPALGTRAHVHSVHPLGTDPLLFLGISSASAGDTE